MTALRHVLLLVQAALSGLVTVEVLLLTAVLHSPVLLALALVTGWSALVPVGVALGLAAGWGWARGAGVGYELLLLISGFVDAAILRNDDLVSLLTTLVLPGLVLWLLSRAQSSGVSESGRPAWWSSAIR